MKRYLVKYQWYETVYCAYIEAKTERLALLKFIFADLKHQKKEDGFLSLYDENIKKQVKDILDDKSSERDYIQVKEITDKKAFIWF